MAISKEAYKALEAIVGKEYISSEPAVCEGYRSGPAGYEAGLGYERVMTKIPGCVIMPRTTEEVQKIVGLATAGTEMDVGNPDSAVPGFRNDPVHLRPSLRTVSLVQQAARIT